MHTHFGSATFSLSAFLSVLLFGSFWRLGWMHVLSAGINRGSRWMQGIARACLFQY